MIDLIFIMDLLFCHHLISNWCSGLKTVCYYFTWHCGSVWARADISLRTGGDETISRLCYNSYSIKLVSAQVPCLVHHCVKPTRSCSHSHVENINNNSPQAETEMMLSFPALTVFSLKAALCKQSAFTKDGHGRTDGRKDISHFSLSVKMTHALVDKPERRPSLLSWTKRLLFSFLSSVGCLSSAGKNTISFVIFGKSWLGKKINAIHPAIMSIFVKFQIIGLPLLLSFKGIKNNIETWAEEMKLFYYFVFFYF